MHDDKGKWLDAGGEYQIPFMGVASRLLKGGTKIACPKCEHKFLRFYFHAFHVAPRQGTVWVWCIECRTTCHLPRQQPKAAQPQDPFEDLSLQDFARLETDLREPLLDRLDRLWDEGAIDYPGADRGR